MVAVCIPEGGAASKRGDALTARRAHRTTTGRSVGA